MPELWDAPLGWGAVTPSKTCQPAQTSAACPNGSPFPGTHQLCCVKLGQEQLHCSESGSFPGTRRHPGNAFGVQHESPVILLSPQPSFTGLSVKSTA